MHIQKRQAAVLSHTNAKSCAEHVGVCATAIHRSSTDPHPVTGTSTPLSLLPPSLPSPAPVTTPSGPPRVRPQIHTPYGHKSDSFYFVDDKLIMHNKAEYAYEH